MDLSLKKYKDFINENFPQQYSQDGRVDSPHTFNINPLGEEVDEYMFFQNLINMKEQIEELLQMNPEKVDELLRDGHAWAVDHVATAKEDVEQVYSFLNARVNESLNERKKINWGKNLEKKSTGNKMLDKFIRELGDSVVYAYWNYISVSNAVLDFNRDATFDLGFKDDKWICSSMGESVEKPAKEIKNTEQLYRFVTGVVNGFSFTRESVEINEGKGYDYARKLIAELRAKVYRKWSDADIEEFSREMADHIGAKLDESVNEAEKFNYKDTGLKGKYLKDVKDGIAGIKRALKTGNKESLISNYDIVQQRVQQYGEGPNKYDFLEAVQKMAGLDESVNEAEKKSEKVEEKPKIGDLKNSYSVDNAWWELWKSNVGEKEGYEFQEDGMSKTYIVKKDGKVIFVFDYQRNKVFTNESPDIVIIPFTVDKEAVEDAEKKGKELSDEDPEGDGVNPDEKSKPKKAEEE